MLSAERAMDSESSAGSIGRLILRSSLGKAVRARRGLGGRGLESWGGGGWGWGVQPARSTRVRGERAPRVPTFADGEVESLREGGALPVAVRVRVEDGRARVPVQERGVCIP